MSKFPWKTTLTVSALFAATTYAFAQMSPSDMHRQMQHGDMMNQMHHQATRGQDVGSVSLPTMPGQDAFGAIQEIVQILQSDPKTDWSKVNIEALRQHLIDMNEVTLHAAASRRDIDEGIEITVTGEGRTLNAIKRMVPAHVAELRKIGWNAKSDELPNGVKLTVMASEAQPLIKLDALGFMGIMVQGPHHQLHHLLIAKGEMHGH